MIFLFLVFLFFCWSVGLFSWCLNVFDEFLLLKSTSSLFQPVSYQMVIIPFFGTRLGHMRSIQDSPYLCNVYYSKSILIYMLIFMCMYIYTYIYIWYIFICVYSNTMCRISKSLRSNMTFGRLLGLFQDCEPSHVVDDGVDHDRHTCLLAPAQRDPRISNVFAKDLWNFGRLTRWFFFEQPWFLPCNRVASKGRKRSFLLLLVLLHVSDGVLLFYHNNQNKW